MAKKIAFIVGDDGPSGYFRIILPCQALKQQGDNIGFAWVIEDFEAADTLVFQRQSRPEAIAEILRWQSLGKKIVMDFDDNFLQLDPTNEANRVYTAQVKDNLKRLLEKVDVVTVATGPLAKVYGDYCAKVFVIPNTLSSQVFAKTKRETSKIILGWQGSGSHYGDLKLVRSALTALRRKYDFELVLAGYNPPGMFKDATFRPWAAFSPELTYYDLFLDFDIGICPLVKSPFNECKSDLKWLEYSSLAIPTVASAAPAYHEIEPGKTGLLARNLREWEEALGGLLTDESLRRRIGSSAKDYVLANRTIEGNVWRWREALNAAL